MKNIVRILTLFVVFSLTGQEKDQKSTAADNVRLLQKTFLVPELNDIAHKIWIYLPPNYDGQKKFPVIYMHDGQNLFDSSTSYLGEWGVDEILNSYFEQTGKGFIVVGIENSGLERINEYTPWPHEKYGGGKGSIYVDFIVKTLKPFIDGIYRTKKNAKNTAISGSSLGGLISFYAGLKYPDVFGKVGALSSSFWFSDKIISFTEKHGDQKHQKLYLLMGGAEGKNMVEGQKNIEQILISSGFKSENLIAKVIAEGKHNEAFWNSEFLNMITWLFNKNQS